MPPILSFRYLALAPTGRADLYIHLAVPHPLALCLNLIIGKDSPSQFRYRYLFPRYDVKSLVWCVSASLTIGTSDHRIPTAYRAVIGDVSSTYRAAHRLPSSPSSICTHPSAKMIEAVQRWSGFVNSATIARTPATAQMMFRLNVFSMLLCLYLV